MHCQNDHLCEQCRTGYEIDSDLNQCIKIESNTTKKVVDWNWALPGVYRGPDGRFYPCNKLCQKCSGSASHCTSCYHGFILSGHSCVCPYGAYYDSSLMACQYCNRLCLSCTAATVCTSCAENAAIVNTATKHFCECIHPLEFFPIQKIIIIGKF